MPKKIERIKIKLRKKDQLYLIESNRDVITYLHNWLKGVDKIIIEVTREKK